MSSPIGLSPVLISSKLEGNSLGLASGETKAFTVFRHEYAVPYLLDEIRIGPIDTTVDWRIYHGGLSLCGDWVSPFAMCKKLNPEEQQNSRDINDAPGLIEAGMGLLSILQFKLAYPMLVMPDEQITIRLQRQPLIGNPSQVVGPVQYLNPYCVLQGRSLKSGFVPPARKVVPFATGFRYAFPQVVGDLPMVELFQSGDGDITNPNKEDLKLDRFGLLTSLDHETSDEVGRGVPFPIPVSVQISDSEGAYIAKDPTDMLLLGNGNTRIWDVRGTLRANQFWTVRAEANLSPYSADNAYMNSNFSLLGALTGYRQIDNTQPLDLTKGFYGQGTPP